MFVISAYVLSFILFATIFGALVALLLKSLGVFDKKSNTISTTPSA
ncbi:MAG: hypothetical protein SFY32_09235 [Bacteroidota bacterium]|nr:hypothetical protein [Bacteroidota bacterium]